MRMLKKRNKIILSGSHFSPTRLIYFWLQRHKVNIKL